KGDGDVIGAEYNDLHWLAASYSISQACATGQSRNRRCPRDLAAADGLGGILLPTGQKFPDLLHLPASSGRSRCSGDFPRVATSRWNRAGCRPVSGNATDSAASAAGCREAVARPRDGGAP